MYNLCSWFSQYPVPIPTLIGTWLKTCLQVMKIHVKMDHVRIQIPDWTEWLKLISPFLLLQWVWVRDQYKFSWIFLLPLFLQIFLARKLQFKAVMLNFLNAPIMYSRIMLFDVYEDNTRFSYLIFVKTYIPVKSICTWVYVMMT